MTAVSARKGKRKMKTVTEKLGEIVAGAFEACGYDGKLGAVSISDREDLCQFQCNGAFDGAKLYKKPPFVWFTNKKYTYYKIITLIYIIIN